MPALVGRGATIVAESFETLDAWRITTVGPAMAELGDSGGQGSCLKVRSLGGLAMCSRDLPVAELRGAKLTVRCMTRVAAVGPGPQPWSTAKIHVAIKSPTGVRHATGRLSQVSEWQKTSLVAEVPPDAIRILLSLGVENAPAEVAFDSLLVTTDRGESRPLDLADHATLALPGVPRESLTWEGVGFQPLRDGKGLALRGEGHDDFPKQLERKIPVNAVVDRVCFLQAVLPAPGKRETPCMIWTARFWDGHETSFSVFEGRDIGAIDSTQGLGNWKVAWEGTDARGQPLQLGVTTWRVFTTDVPIESLRVRAYAGAAPFVAAVTVVADPPAPEGSGDESNEWENGGWEE